MMPAVSLSPVLSVSPGEPREPSEIPASGLIVGSKRLLQSGPPGLSRILGLDGASNTDSDEWVAVGIDLRGLAPLEARRSLAWIQERLARGDAFRLDEHEEEVELIQDRTRILTIIESLIAREARGHAMLIGSGARAADAVPARLTIDGTVLLETGHGKQILEPPFDVQLDGFHSVYQFEWSRDPMREPPEAIVRVRRRRQRRVRAPFRFRARFRHPLWDTIAIDAPVRDLSLEGISIDTDATRDLLYPGLVVRDLELSWKGGVPIRCDARVRHVTQRARSAEHGVGLRLTLSRESAALWHREVEGVLHPMTRRGVSDPEVFWENYQASGYFKLSGKNAEDFAELRSAFARSHTQLCDAPEVGAAFTCSSERRVESVAHQVSPWAGSWVFYHFSRRPDARPLSAAGDEALLDLYAHAYEYVQEQPNAQWLVTYVQKTARFSSLIFNDLTARYAKIGRANVTEFRALEMDSACETTRDGRFDVAVARPDEAMLVAAAVRAARPAMYVSATGLSQVNLGIDATLGAWEGAGLDRRRVVLVARRGGRVVAGAVLDSVAQGLHLFGLFDMVRLYATTPLGQHAYGTLLDAARDWFRGRGRKRFAYFCDQAEDPSGTERPGVTDLGEATMTILPVKLLPELLEHVFVLTSRRAPASRRGSEPPAPPARVPGELPRSPGGE